MTYVVYVMECADSTYYTGICTDVDRRLMEHNESSRGARYTRSRRPVRYIYQETCSDRSEALQREYTIRHLSRADKLKLAQQWAFNCPRLEN